MLCSGKLVRIRPGLANRPQTWHATTNICFCYHDLCYNIAIAIAYWRQVQFHPREQEVVKPFQKLPLTQEWCLWIYVYIHILHIYNTACVCVYICISKLLHTLLGMLIHKLRVLAHSWICLFVEDACSKQMFPSSQPHNALRWIVVTYIFILHINI